MISLIMPTRNAADYIEEAVQAVINSTYASWELIIINDHSSDGTKQLVTEKFQDERIKVLDNPGRGKVHALNFGFSCSRGDIIKFIDSDDLITRDCLETVSSYEVACHDAFIVNDNLRRLGLYRVNKQIVDQDYEKVLIHLIGIPRWSWSMTREVAKKVFPMPEDLPFEDVWFSLLIKRHANKLKHIKEPLYMYRQHEKQTFGGILNYSKSVLNFRANRMIQLITVLEKASERVGIVDESSMDFGKTYYGLLSSGFSVRRILQASLGIQFKFKLLLICFTPSMAILVTKIKWALDNS